MFNQERHLQNYYQACAQQDWDDYCSEVSSEPGSNPPVGYYRPRNQSIITREFNSMEELLEEEKSN